MIRLDSRTSDAIAIALRVKCDIYTTSEIVKECGVVLEEVSPEKVVDEEKGLLELEPEDIKDEKLLKKWLSLLEQEELSERLNEAISKENYEYARMYRDEIKRREEEEKD